MVSCTNEKEQSNNATCEDIINKERSLWQAWKTHDRNVWEALTAGNYRYVGDEGTMTRAGVLNEFLGSW